jgi:hypothetical protein
LSSESVGNYISSNEAAPQTDEMYIGWMSDIR